MNLFQMGAFNLHSGDTSGWKIECDNLRESDWETLAWLLWKRLPEFGKVVPIPKGGIELAKALEKYIVSQSSCIIICDDVMTTGKSLDDSRKSVHSAFDVPVMGAVAFARKVPPPWIKAVFIYDG